MRFIVGGIVVLAASAAAAAADLKVPSVTYPTIQDAATAAMPGDRILVAKGVYFENVTLNSSDVQVLGKKAIWDGAIGAVEGPCLTATGDDIVVQGFTFRNGTDQLTVTGARARVQKCTFVGSSDAAAHINGNNALIEKCKFVNVDDGAAEVVGDDALVQKNTVNMSEDEEGVVVTGARATVLKNKFFGTEGGVEVNGIDCLVEGNLGFGLGDAMVNVTGDNVTIRGNKAAFFPNDTDGFSVTGTGGIIEGNLLKDVMQIGFNLSVSGMTIRGNSVQRVGSESDEAFDISGNGNTIEGNRAQDVDDDGFLVNGNANFLRGNAVKNCGGDGFDIGSGTDNLLEDCLATLCAGEGLDNGGTNTDVSGGAYFGNRLDIANDGTYDLFEMVFFGTGGTTTPSQLD